MSNDAILKLSRECGRLLAKKDGVIFRDSRVLKSLLATQNLHRPSRSYLFQAHGDIRPYMRKIVTSWMLEVCEEYGCEDQVFPLAVNYMDRFLSQRTISRNQLQLLGAVCLFISSKLRQCRALGLQQLVYLTDYSVSEQQIREFELVVLYRLNWDLSSVTAFDFVEQIIERTSLSDKETMIRRHGHTFIALCATEDEFMELPAGLIAGASVAAAVCGMKLPEAEQCLQQIADCVHVQLSELRAAMLRIEELVQLEMTSAQGAATTAARPEATPAPGKTSPSSTDSFSQPDTPTDAHDVSF